MEGREWVVKKQRCLSHHEQQLCSFSHCTSFKILCQVESCLIILKSICLNSKPMTLRVFFFGGERVINSKLKLASFPLTCSQDILCYCCVVPACLVSINCVYTLVCRLKLSPSLKLSTPLNDACIPLSKQYWP